MAERIHKNETRSHRTAYRGKAALLGVPFVLVGGFLALMGFEVIPLVGTAHAPLWVIGAIGCAFGLAGLLLVRLGLAGRLAARRREDVARMHPDRPWLADHAWDPHEIRDDPLGLCVRHLVAAGFFAVFLAPFNWWAFLSKDGHLVVRIVVGFFDLIFLLVAGNALYVLARALKYGGARLRLARFPFHPGERIGFVFSPNRFDRLKVTLRFHEERFEVHGTHRNRSRRLVVYEHYRDTREVETSRLTPEVDLAFELPDDPAWTTELGGTPVRYWELHVAADVPGLDYETSFPLPVYPRPGARRSQDAKDAEQIGAGEAVTPTSP